MYNDGVKIYYFNSVGNKGGSEELRTFLKYIAQSKEENIVDEATEEIGSYVEQIKSNSQMEGNYMTVGEWIDGIVEEAVADAVAEAVAEKDIELAEKDAKLGAKDAELAKKDAEIKSLKEELEKQALNIKQ